MDTARWIGQRRWFWVLAAILVSAPPAPAATPEDEDNASTAAQGQNQVVVISATRIETPASDIGSTVTVILPQELASKQQTLIVDVLRDVPGVDVRRQAGPGSLTTIFIRGTESDHTLVLVDGVKVHDTSAPGGAAVLDHLPVDSIARIEVLRGPQSGLYGGEAIGGVINIVTKKGAGAPTFSFSLEGGSHDTAVERFSSSGGNDHLNYAVSLVRFDSGGFSSLAADATNEKDPYRSTSFASRFGIEASEQAGVDLYLRYIDSQVEFDDNFFGVHNTTQTDAEQLIFKVEPHVILKDGMWEQKLGIWVHDMERKTFGSLPSMFESTLVGIDWQHNLFIFDDHALTFGVEFEHESAEFAGTKTANAHTLSFYAQDQITLIAQRLFSTLSLRLDEHNAFGSEVTYRAAAAYKHLETATTLRASVGTGFKAPALEDLFDSVSFVNNPDLKAETSIGFDVGIEQSLCNDHITAGATYFYNAFDDMIFYDGATFQLGNVGDAVANGVELFLTARPVDSVLARASYTYTDTEVKRAQGTFGPQPGAQLLRRPLHKLSGALAYTFLQGKADAAVNVQYVGQRDDSGGSAAAYTVVNLTGSYRVNAHVLLFVRVENLFNEQYQELAGFNTADASAYGGAQIEF
jgi:vitamin B12 transporter